MLKKHWNCSQFNFKFTKSQIPILVFGIFLWEKVSESGGLGARKCVSVKSDWCVFSFVERTNVSLL